MASILNMDCANQHVQNEVVSGENVSSEQTLILAGPSRLEMLTSQGNANFLASSNSLIPIGLLTGFEMSQVRNISRLYEICSNLPAFGGTGSITMSGGTLTTTNRSFIGDGAESTPAWR